MAPAPNDSQEGALADTRIELSGSKPAKGAPEGRGCLLQIYPVPSLPGLIRLGSSRCVIGRDSACHITIEDTSVSRMHAAVEWTNGAYQITDLNSTNGSWVGDSRLTSQATLQGGELVRLGNTILKFMLVVDEEAQYHAIVQELMMRDPLTNALNRGYLIPLLGRELTACRQNGGPLSIIMLDVDRFKVVNDKLGHVIGDEVLRILCERTRHVIDGSHSLCRFGGDEFVVVCPQSPLDMTVQFAELIRREIAEFPFVTQSGQLKVTCSIGVTCTDGRSLADVDSLLSAADKLLYRAKAQGRNCVHRADGRAIAGSRTSG